MFPTMVYPIFTIIICCFAEALENPICVLCRLWMSSIQNWRGNSPWKEYCLFFLSVPLFLSPSSSLYSSFLFCFLPCTFSSVPPSFLPSPFSLYSCLLSSMGLPWFYSNWGPWEGQSPKTLGRSFKFFEFWFFLLSPLQPKLLQPPYTQYILTEIFSLCRMAHTFFPPNRSSHPFAGLASRPSSLAVHSMAQLKWASFSMPSLVLLAGQDGIVISNTCYFPSHPVSFNL